MSSSYTNFPSGYPFYGGITLTYGVGKHEDWNATLKMGETFRADYLNNTEHRINNLEHVVNQIEEFILWPNGSINEELDRTSLPANGEYYQNSNYSILASGINKLIQLLGEADVIDPNDIDGYPFHV